MWVIYMHFLSAYRLTANIHEIKVRWGTMFRVDIIHFVLI